MTKPKPINSSSEMRGQQLIATAAAPLPPQDGLRATEDSWIERLRQEIHPLPRSGEDNPLDLMLEKNLAAAKRQTREIEEDILQAKDELIKAYEQITTLNKTIAELRHALSEAYQRLDERDQNEEALQKKLRHQEKLVNQILSKPPSASAIR